MGGRIAFLCLKLGCDPACDDGRQFFAEDLSIRDALAVPADDERLSVAANARAQRQ